MTKKQTDRMNRLMPNGEPKYIRVYDDGKSTDRYTVVYTGNYGSKGDHQYVGMGESPFHPQGCCIHGSWYRPIDVNSGGFPPKIGRKNHLGKRITFSELPKDCQTVVVNDYCSLWSL
jgi:hypothetical protein